VSIKPDHWIRRMALDHGMISPFVDFQVRKMVSDVGIIPCEQKIISYGVSSYGYDARLGDDFRIFTAATGRLSVIDPKALDYAAMQRFSGPEVIIPPNSFVLGHTVEYFRIPRDVMVICLGKSTYARCGAIVNVTPLEPEWEGHVTIEISNTTPLPLKVYANEGIAQFLFFQADQGDWPTVSYKDRNGKYQGQTGVTLPIT